MVTKKLLKSSISFLAPQAREALDTCFHQKTALTSLTNLLNQHIYYPRDRNLSRTDDQFASTHSRHRGFPMEEQHRGAK